MQARAPLMIEHRLIERMIAIVTRAVPRIRSENRADPVFLDTVVDFFHSYVDLVHHGKEEAIMFRNLDKKEMSEPDRTVMRELIVEHEFARKITAETAGSVARYRNGEDTALRGVVDGFSTFADFYPKHIEKEDKVFFPASHTYLSEQEEQAMLAGFWEYDRKMLQEIYRERIEELERHPEFSKEAVR
ncbi:MAG: hemerythrin domain-containing protein [Candidatus Latescibacterota bacterium]